MVSGEKMRWVKIQLDDMDHRFWSKVPFTRASHFGVTLFLTHPEAPGAFNGRPDPSINTPEVHFRTYLSGWIESDVHLESP